MSQGVIIVLIAVATAVVVGAILAFAICKHMKRNKSAGTSVPGEPAAVSVTNSAADRL